MSPVEPTKNLQLFLECLNHREPLIDTYYCTNELIISQDPTTKTMVMENNCELIDRIGAARCAIQDDDISQFLKHTISISSLIEKENMNYTEFCSFFPTMDVSHSQFMELNSSEKTDFVAKILRKFIETRHSIYKAHGYTATTIQCRKDFEKHKSSGNMANVKLEKILRETLSYTKVNKPSEMATKPKSFWIIPSTNGPNLELINFLRNLEVEFQWQDLHEGKNPDMLLKINDIYYVIECKHIKEQGGGQHKQVLELINLISHNSGNSQVSFMSFLDGAYFNLFQNAKKGKVYQQRQTIETHLKTNPNNYFVNTHGFIRLASCFE